MPNHFHLLLKSGQTPIATLMRRLLTGYAVSFNLRIGEAVIFSRSATSPFDGFGSHTKNIRLHILSIGTIGIEKPDSTHRVRSTKSP